MSDGVNINIATEGGSLERSPVTIGDITGRDHIDHGKAETVDARSLYARIEAQDRRIEAQDRRIQELERFVFGDAALGVFSVRVEIKGLKFWIATSTVITLLWVIYEIIRATR